ncbi:MAG: hypothetical protein AAFY17_13445 [Cyanobacteria bacterium J06642_11]
MKHIKHLWQLTPKVLRSLLAAILILAVAAGSVLAAQGSSTAQATPSVSDQLISRRSSPGIYAAPSTCAIAAPIVPALVTEKEIELRQFHRDFAKFIEEQAKLDNAAGLTFDRDVMAIEKYRLDCEVMVLRAKQILAAGDIFSLPELPVSAREIALRKRQLEIARRIDAETTVAQSEGLDSLNKLWQTRRDRTDAEILLLQAETQKKLQEMQENPA